MLESLMNEMNLTTTENGAKAYGSTGSDCLDLFATIGAIRRLSKNEIIDRFIRAFSEDKDLAMKILFYARDIRGGLGERRVFRAILRWLGFNHPESVSKNIEYIAEYGRFDDVLSLLGTYCEKDVLMYLKKQFDMDIKALESGGEVSLLGKWLPSINASCPKTVKNAKKLARAFGMSFSEYRRALSALRKKIAIIENNLRERDYSFDYSKQASGAMFKYRKAFIRNDNERYLGFINDVQNGKVKLNASNIMPYQVVEILLKNHIKGRYYHVNDNDCYISPEEAQVLNATWESLPDFGTDENVLAVVDGSGSMYMYGNPMPISVAISLGLYCAEHNKGAFSGHFIEFSNKPELIKIKGENFVEKVQYISTFDDIADTNLAAVFHTILEFAIKNNVPQDELPSKLVIISDMEFNCCVNNSSETNFEHAKRVFEENGYKLPEIVFWNVASRHLHQEVTMDERGVVLVSGVTPRLFSMVLGENMTPYELMMEVLGGERYKQIAA
ncbi:MAG: DUF2828 family protein [Lachnospiraceae bacterium]|nr:DUF2828 family protein [Lachnospiraceae bacterium]